MRKKFWSFLLGIFGLWRSFGGVGFCFAPRGAKGIGGISHTHKFHRRFWRFYKATPLMILFLFSLSVSAQKVEVDQSFIDSATKAFDLVAQQREALAKFAAERAATDAERQKAEMLIKAFDELIAIKNQTLAAKDDLIKVYAEIIKTQQLIIDKLQNYLNKPKSFWQKFLNGVKEVLKAGFYILVGRGLAGL